MVEWDSAKLLEICGKEHEREYLEAWNIRLHQSSMNRDEGLPSIYNSLIREEIGRPKVFMSV